MLFPPISVQGTVERELNLPGIESLKSMHISPKKITFTVSSGTSTKIIETVTFNSPITDINFRIQPTDTYPLELMPIATVEFLEALSQFD